MKPSWPYGIDLAAVASPTEKRCHLPNRLLKAMALVWIVFTVPLAGANVDTADRRRARIEHLEDSLLAPCCYTGPVSRHESEMAIKMRLEIKNWVNAGKTDAEILATYKERYGAKVLVAPPGESWWWTNGVPWALIVLGTAAVVFLLARWRAKPEPSAPADNATLPNVPESDEEWARMEPPAIPPGSAARR
jgi:cytochrome c-type biogenesis protein CcmH/NrfF